MNNVEKGAIIFDKYLVKKVGFVLNTDYNEEEVNIHFGVGTNVELSDDKSQMIVELELNIFKDAIKNNYPFEMNLNIEGHFIINEEEENAVDKYQANAIAILYPYARAIVSTYTASANISPLILPTVNVNKLLKNKKEVKE